MFRIFGLNILNMPPLLNSVNTIFTYQCTDDVNMFYSDISPMQISSLLVLVVVGKGGGEGYIVQEALTG